MVKYFQKILFLSFIFYLYLLVCDFHSLFYSLHFRLLILSTCCGLAGTLLTISSYRRVPCHLQDPLKGAALVYSLVFYFFFCRKGKSILYFSYKLNENEDDRMSLVWYMQYIQEMCDERIFFFFW